ncbi:sulfatase-like hydrolase/transferase [Poritiphilus flavus]|uniref:Sulfatase-like hydrolase/transferase n=1 Tax=Poritiphilus flavus TaxID=2697053 RepID=A0A6L9EDT4_9FLAO|nr:sulfatase-like hydrolase/transferase [Poritiphilus flavus]NAS12875.1 sulfatase-like hydrolase/transferase [Poritiphilus flavus]
MKKLFFLSVLIVLTSCAEQKDQEASKPNIVFIFADDMTYTAIHALGNQEIATPNLDKLVNTGATFTHAYNMGAWNGAVCVASRAMIISGRSVWEANEFRQEWLQDRNLDKTWGKLMEQAGYDTYMTGKWHVDAPPEKVFGQVVHPRPGMPPDAWEHHPMVEKFKSIEGTDKHPSSVMPVGYNRPLSEKDSSWSPTDKSFGGFWEGGKHWSEVLRDDALQFISEAAGRDKPFFMYLAFNAPHDPRQAPPEYIAMYKAEELDLPENWLPEYPFKEAIGNGPKLRDEALAPYPRTAYALKKHKQEYYAIITHLDQQIGEILNGLEQSGKKENTYIIFTADHGLALGRHGLMGKQSLFDHSIRVPFLISGPGIPAGKQIAEDIYLQDAMATSLDLAGIERPDYLYFHSLMGLINGEQQGSSYDGIYGGYINFQRMIRKDGFKLVVYPKINKLLLFDLKTDPQEMRDLSGQPQYKSKVDLLFKELRQMQQELKDTLDLSGVYEPGS